MINCSIFAIGNELLEGSIIDTNSAYLARLLSNLGINIKRVNLLKDNLNEIVDALRLAENDSEIIVTTGGLGPTFDDLTSCACAEAFYYDFEVNEIALNHITSMLSSRGVTIKESHKRQAMLPKGCLLFDNKVGTALGFAVKTKKGFCFSLPGIPYEMKHIFESSMLDFIKNNFKLEEVYRLDLKFKGLPESDVDDVIRNIDIPDDVECIINVSKGEIIVRLRSFNLQHLDKVKQILISKLNDNFFGTGDESLQSVLLRKLIEKKLTIATAESCTGGLIAKKITDVPGSSSAFLGSIVAYSNDVKSKILHVPEDVLLNYGAVSKECAANMVDGLKKIFNCDLAISVTGIAGPDGGSEEKPVGLVYIGVLFKDAVEVKRYEFRGDREAIRERAANAALSIAIDIIK